VDLWNGLDQTLERFGLCFACELVDYNYVVMMDLSIMTCDDVLYNALVFVDVYMCICGGQIRI
jgi:hypothetical protein